MKAAEVDARLLGTFQKHELTDFACSNIVFWEADPEHSTPAEREFYTILQGAFSARPTFAPRLVAVTYCMNSGLTQMGYGLVAAEKRRGRPSISTRVWPSVAAWVAYRQTP